jgi:DsbC/DsbD-like thiol-disulfide interchange protein
MSRFIVTLCATFALAGSTSTHAQSLLAKGAVQHATIAASASALTAAAGSAITLWAEVTPNPSIHIYAAGAKDFTPVALSIPAGPQFTPGKARYPKPDVATAPGALDAVPAYKQPFRIAVPVTIKATAKPGSTVAVAGVVTYQACDDRLCYPVTTAPVNWNVSVK